MKAVILAAGYGTRFLKDLQNINDQTLKDLIGTPKSLLPIGGFPLISYWIEALKTVLEPKDIYIVTNEMYYSKFEKWKKNYPFVTVINDGTSTNEGRLGAMSCLQLVIEKFEIDENTIVIGGDTLFYEDFHLEDVLKQYEILYQDNNQANLVLSYICTDEEIKNYGILETDKNCRIVAIKEKPLAKDTTSRQADAPLNEKDAPGHFLSWLVTRKPVYFYSISGRFDVGNLKTYLLCDKYFQDKKCELNYLQ
ncbi:choline-phosphate cytidylyltransferase-like isoform X2 [Engystomops pustulosus]|uniref:choline-phosphate cytidylyltransferase-like isoform X2 n=1 Tax=Engystomops pustulosus TaxID=76066 RepID=UPI003AFA91AB